MAHDDCTPLVFYAWCLAPAGHLVAWDARLQYEITKASDAGWIASWLSGEGLVCRFMGQGQVVRDKYGTVVLVLKVGRQYHLIVLLGVKEIKTNSCFEKGEIQSFGDGC